MKKILELIKNVLFLVFYIIRLIVAIPFAILSFIGFGMVIPFGLITNKLVGAKLFKIYHKEN